MGLIEYRVIQSNSCFAYRVLYMNIIHYFTLFSATKCAATTIWNYARFDGIHSERVVDASPQAGTLDKSTR